MPRNVGRIGSLIGFIALIAASFLGIATGVSTEIKTGRVDGAVVLGESGKPLPNALVTFLRVQEDDLLPNRQAVVETLEDGKFSLRGLPSGSYTVQVAAKAHSLTKDVVIQIRDDQVTPLNLKLVPTSPYLNAYASKKVFTPEDKPFIQVTGFHPTQQLRIRYWKLDMKRLTEEGGLYTALSELTKNEPLPTQEPQRNSFFDLNAKDAEGVFEETIETDPLPAGVYMAGVETIDSKSSDPKSKDNKKLIQRLILYVSDLALVAKVGENSIATYATDLRTGKPVGDVPVILVSKAGQQKLGSTDGNGLLQSKLSDLGKGSSDIAAVATRGDSVSVVNLYHYNRDAEGTVAVVTDRPIYRPGDTVQWRAIARKSNPTGYTPLASTTYTATLKDADGKRIGSATGKTNMFGSAAGSFALPAEDARYSSLEIEVGNLDGYQSVAVASYRKPEFSIQVSPENPVAIRGDAIRFKVKCEYFFGGPVVGAKVTGSFFAKDLWWSPSPDEEDEYLWEDESYDGDYLSDFSDVITDANGEAWINVPADALKWGAERTVDKQITVSVSATEDDEHYFDGKGSVKVYRGDTDLRVETSNFVVDPKEEVTARVKMRTLDGQPVRNQWVDVEFGLDQWHSNGVVFASVDKKRVNTDDQGEAMISFVPDRPGDYRVIARSADSKNRSVEADCTLWVYGGGFDWDNSGDLQVALDKREYQPGEAMKLVLRSSKKDGHAWVTVETGDVVQQKVVSLDQGSAEVEFTAPDVPAPNAHIGVAMVHQRKFYERTRSFRVSLNKRALAVTVTPSTPKAKPGDEVSFAIKTATLDGKPTPAEVSLGIVDEAIYAIAEDRTNLMEDFYPRTWSNVSTAYSFPEVYLDGGDKAPKNVEIRKDFRDTASWFPSIVTDADGRASVSIKLPDNLTAWRATAQACSMKTEVGAGTGKIQVKKDLMLRFQVPAYLAQFDKTQLTAILQNGSDKPLEPTVILNLSGAKQFKSEPQKVKIQPGETQVLHWPIDLPESGSMTILATAADGSISDGVQTDVKILPVGKPALFDRSLFIEEGQSAEVVVPAMDPNFKGTAEITFSSSRLSSLWSAVPDLIEYPYGCVEQTMSRFMPAVIVARVSKELGLPLGEDEEKIRKVAEASLTRLKTMRHSDGAWGWWENDASSERMTALVLDGLFMAKSAGFPIDDDMVNPALEWAKNRLESTTPQDPWMGARVPLAAAMLHFGQSTKAYQVLAEANIEKESEAANLAEIVTGLSEVKSDSSRSLAGKALERAKQIVLERDRSEWGWWWNGTAATARVLIAQLVYDPTSSDVDRLADKVMQTRIGPSWNSTYDTAQSILAISMLAAIRRELAGPVQVQLVQNGREPSMITVDGRTEPQKTVPITPRELSEGIRFNIQANGGPVYCSVRVKGIEPASKVDAQGRKGWGLSRSFHRLVAGKTDEGRTGLVAEKAATTSLKSGDVVRGIVELEIAEPQSFVMVEVPLPSNMRVRENTDMEEWGYWFDGMQIFDDRITFFASYLTKGKHSFEFHMRAETAGTAIIPPCRAMPMYAPAEGVWTSSSSMEVKP